MDSERLNIVFDLDNVIVEPLQYDSDNIIERATSVFGEKIIKDHLIFAYDSPHLVFPGFYANDLNIQHYYLFCASGYEGNRPVNFNCFRTFTTRDDIHKPIFNGYKLLGKLGDQLVDVTLQSDYNEFFTIATRKSDGSIVLMVTHFDESAVYNHSNAFTARKSGFTQPLTFQGLSSFFLKCFLLLHKIYFLHIPIQPSYQPVILMTTWHILLVDHYNIT